MAGCGATTTTATIYAVETSHLTGSLPLCFSDPDSNQTLTIYKDNGFGNAPTEIYSVSTPVDRATTSTTTIFTTANFSTNPNEIKFLISDGSTDRKDAYFRLTLLPAFKVKFLNSDGNGTEFANSANTPNNLVVYVGRSVNTAFGSTYTHTPSRTAPTGGI